VDTDLQEKTKKFLQLRIVELEKLQERGIKKVSLPMDGKTFLVDESLEIFKRMLTND
tara:strand:- start:66 stop:236 length:171 start_codon:yes stop_codon:yes gene_type:complete